MCDKNKEITLKNWLDKVRESTINNLWLHNHVNLQFRNEQGSEHKDYCTGNNKLLDSSVT